MGRNRNSAPRQSARDYWRHHCQLTRQGFARGCQWIWDDYRRQFVLDIPGVYCPQPIVRRRWDRRTIASHTNCEIVEYPPWQWSNGPRFALRIWSNASSNRTRSDWLLNLGWEADYSRSYTYDGTVEIPLTPVDNPNSDD